MAHKIRHATAARDANYQLAGLIEIDDSYFGGSKPGKRDGEPVTKPKLFWRLKTVMIIPDSQKPRWYLGLMVLR